MIKIGIVGTDTKVFQAGKLVRKINGFELVGCYDDDCLLINELADLHQVMAFYSYDTLFEKVDAVIVNAGIADSVSVIGKCLRNFKHVFVIDVNRMRSNDLNYFLKLSRESNVCFFPEFGFKGTAILDILADYRGDLQFADIRHSLGRSDKFCSGPFLSSLLLSDLTFLYEVTGAKVQKVQANGWNFNPAGTGMINARLDFDNGLLTNLLVINSGRREDFQMVLYSTSYCVKVLCEGDKVSIVKEDFLGIKLDIKEMVLPSSDSLKQELQMFYHSIIEESSVMDCMENKYEIMRALFLIKERINQFISSDIFSY